MCESYREFVCLFVNLENSIFLFARQRKRKKNRKTGEEEVEAEREDTAEGGENNDDKLLEHFLFFPSDFFIRSSFRRCCTPQVL